MAFLVVPVFACVTQGCCWYSVFKCCGCIEDRKHVEIEKQKAVLVVGPSNNNPFSPASQTLPSTSTSDNPFVNPGAAKDCHRSAYR